MSNNNSTTSGIAGRTNYSEWDKKASQLLSNLEVEEKEEEEKAQSELGLGNKYPRSKAEAEEKIKAQNLAKKKRTLELQKQNQDSLLQILDNLITTTTNDDETTTRFITCKDIEARKRVLTLTNTDGPGDLILTQDLTNLECASSDGIQQQQGSIKGLIKVHLTNLHNLTVTIRCKVITGVLEISHCSNVIVKLEKECTIVTTQADLCQNLTIQLYNVPSGKSLLRGGLSSSTTTDGDNTMLFWGADKDDRIFHAGVSNLKIELFQNGHLGLETIADYKKDGALPVGNATAEEVQFVTSVIDSNLITERILRAGSLTGTTAMGTTSINNKAKGGGEDYSGGSARAMTAREMKEVEKRKEKIRKAVDERLGSAIKIVGKNDNTSSATIKNGNAVLDKKKNCDEQSNLIEEVGTSILSSSEVQSIVKDCEAQKAEGNKAFMAGEYAQAVLSYTLALDKASELSSADGLDANTRNTLFPRHIVLSNRSACFLKLGHHEKALADGTQAEKMDPTYVKGVFRKGLALHAMGHYQEATKTLAVALKLEPKNKQIKQALQFADVRLQQEMRRG